MLKVPPLFILFSISQWSWYIFYILYAVYHGSLCPLHTCLNNVSVPFFFKFQWSKSTKNHTRIDLNISYKILLNLSTNSFGSLINNFNSQFHAKLSTFADMHICLCEYVYIWVKASNFIWNWMAAICLWGASKWEAKLALKIQRVKWNICMMWAEWHVADKKKIQGRLFMPFSKQAVEACHLVYQKLDSQNK